MHQFPANVLLFVVVFLSSSAVHAKSIVAILHLLVALSQHFRAPIRLPDHVSIQVVVVQVGFVLSFPEGCSFSSACLLCWFGKVPPKLELSFKFHPWLFIRLLHKRSLQSLLIWCLPEERGHLAVQANSRRDHWKHWVSTLHCVTLKTQHRFYSDAQSIETKAGATRDFQ